jgi:uncharacterized damage-inducible protein DinB
MMSGKIDLVAHLTRFASEVRGSTLKRFEQVRPNNWHWRHRADLLSFADVLKHLTDADCWLFERLDGGPPSEGIVISPGDANGIDCKVNLEELIQLDEEKARRIRTFTEDDFTSRRFDLGRKGEVDLMHLLLRRNLDHEIHRRGAVQLALRLRYG